VATARAGNGCWQATIPEPDGEIVTTQYTLRAPDDKLDASALFLDAALRVLVR
jgi:hypothetical protein